MAHMPKYKRIEQLKVQASLIADASWNICQNVLDKEAKKVGALSPTAKVPVKFYRRLIGLRNGDLN